MKIKNKTLLKRILAAAAGILIILGLLAGISSVTGNPLFAAIAKGRAQKYLESRYPAYTFTAVSVTQMQKGSFGYEFAMQANEAADVHFDVMVPGSGEISDNYAYWVQERRTTQQRLSKELAACAAEALAASYPELYIKSCEAVYGYDVQDAAVFPAIAFASSFTLDMPFDKASITVPTLLNLVIGAEEPNEALMNRLLPQIKAALAESGLHFDYYTVMLELPDASYDITALQSEPRYNVEVLPQAEIAQAAS